MSDQMNIPSNPSVAQAQASELYANPFPGDENVGWYNVLQDKASKFGMFIRAVTPEKGRTGFGLYAKDDNRPIEGCGVLPLVGIDHFLSQLRVVMVGGEKRIVQEQVALGNIHQDAMDNISVAFEALQVYVTENDDVVYRVLINDAQRQVSEAIASVFSSLIRT